MRMPPPVALTGVPDERDYRSPEFVFGSLTSITLYTDYICPWCYVGFLQALKLTEDYGVTFDWRGAELMPPALLAAAAQTPPPPPKPPAEEGTPAPPPSPKVSRFDRFAEKEGLVPPAPRPQFVSSHLALLGQEFAVRQGYEATVAYNEAVYRGYWERREDISDLSVLTRLAESAGLDGAAFAAAVESEQDIENIVPYDDDAYATGIRHLPLFLFGGEELLTEAPYTSLAAACENFVLRAEKFKAKG